PFFWTDQYGKRVQLVGSPSLSDDFCVVEGSFAQGRMIAEYRRHGSISGMVLVNAPDRLATARAALASSSVVA
ncbi:MAG: NAD(P)/FAD-dependent oxidoreductase, partial [Actinophytocola sp.]|nr:NAD(P)/FAD-dependent oxidoreductase [Actinophytocola sp.]